MKEKSLFIAFALLCAIALVSCNGNNNGGEGEPGNGDGHENNIESAYYNILYDMKKPALEVVDVVFSNYGDNVSFNLIKNKIVDNINDLTEEIELELGIQDVELYYRKINYSYNSIDIGANPIELSSVALWYGYYVGSDTTWHDLAPEKICLMEHYTITSDHESPTQGFPLELFITGNTLTVMPDYIGYGLTRHLNHPYLNHDICATNSIDALPAAYTLFDEMSGVDLNEDWTLCVLGASQGGGNALAIHKMMDNNPELAETWNFEYSFAAAGSHNPLLTIEKYLEKGKVANPVVLPFTIKGMFESYPEILGKYDEEMMLADSYLKVKDSIDQMLMSKNYTTSEINAAFYEYVRVTIDETLAADEVYLTDIFSDEMFDTESEMVQDLYLCLEKNNLTKGWMPTHPIKLYYSVADRTVPYENSISVKEAFGDMVTMNETAEPVDHILACGLWMMRILNQGI